MSKFLAAFVKLVFVRDHHGQHIDAEVARDVGLKRICVEHEVGGFFLDFTPFTAFALLATCLLFAMARNRLRKQEHKLIRA